MVNYQLGKVYEIVCLTTGKRYVGSTTLKYLSYRLAEHKSRLKKGNKDTVCVEVLENSNYKIVLLENYPCNSRDELEAKEYEWINKLECVNKRRGKRGEDYYKEYREAHKEKQREYMKVYYQKRKELTSSSPSVSSLNPPPPPSQQTTSIYSVQSSPQLDNS